MNYGFDIKTGNGVMFYEKGGNRITDPEELLKIVSEQHPSVANINIYNDDGVLVASKGSKDG